MSGRRRLLGRLIASITLITGALLVAPATPAFAAGSWLAPGAVCHSPGCAINRGSQPGSYTINTQPVNFKHSDGRQETWVIGTDSGNSLYHAWQRTPGDSIWHPWTRIHYPGNLRSVAAYDNTPGVRVVDKTFGTVWCIRGPAWNTWFSC